MMMTDYSWRVTSKDVRMIGMDKNDFVKWVERLLTVTCLRVEEWISSDIKKPLAEIIKEVAARAEVSTNRVQIIAAPQYGNCEGVICRVYALAGDHCSEVLAIKMFCQMSKAFDMAQEIALTLDRIVNHGESPAVLGWHEALGMPINHWQLKVGSELVLEHGEGKLILKHGLREVAIAEGEATQWLVGPAQSDVKMLATAMGISWRYVKLDESPASPAALSNVHATAL